MAPPCGRRGVAAAGAERGDEHGGEGGPQCGGAQPAGAEGRPTAAGRESSGHLGFFLRGLPAAPGQRRRARGGGSGVRCSGRRAGCGGRRVTAAEPGAGHLADRGDGHADAASRRTEACRAQGRRRRRSTEGNRDTEAESRRRSARGAAREDGRRSARRWGAGAYGSAVRRLWAGGGGSATESAAGAPQVHVAAHHTGVRREHAAHPGASRRRLSMDTNWCLIRRDDPEARALLEGATVSDR